jgi:hypothetical protein
MIERTNQGEGAPGTQRVREQPSGDTSAGCPPRQRCWTQRSGQAEQERGCSGREEVGGAAGSHAAMQLHREEAHMRRSTVR